MKSTAYLINVARSEIIDVDALVCALDEHWIAGAGLDVFATEPLPANCRLWESPNVIVGPHIAEVMQDYYVQATRLFCRNLRRYLSAQEILNVVNKQKGYQALAIPAS